MRHSDSFAVDLNDVERHLLSHGVMEWSGPARCPHEMAVAMGFADVQEILDSTDRLVAAIDNGEGLPGVDWLRILLLTEIAFASNALGSGLDWSITSGLSDEESLRALRSVQRKLGGIGNVLGVAFGTRQPDA